MLLVYALFFLPLLVTAEMTAPKKLQDLANVQTHNSRGTLDFVTDRLRNAVNVLLPSAKSCDIVEARKRKKLKFNKYVVPLIVGFLLIKSILLPIALKALAVLSGKAVVLSLMSLILAAIVGLKKVAQSSGHNYEVVNLPTSKFRRKDMFEFMDYQEENEPYQFYRDRRKKK